MFDAFAWDGDFKPMFEYLAARFKDYGSSRDGVNCEPLINGFMRSYLMMKTVYVARPELELNGRYCDYAFFPDMRLPAYDQPDHSYVIELKHAPANAPQSKIDANHAEALTQLQAYSQCANLPQLTAGRPIHFLDVEFVGREMIVCEEVRF